MAMGCYLLLSVLMCLLFWPLGIVMLLIGIISAVMGQSKGTAAAATELKRIALLSAPPEVQAAEAERERKQQNIKNTGYLVVLALIGALVAFVWIGSIVWIGSTVNKATTTAVVAATPYVSPTPYNQPDITPMAQAEIEKDARQQQEREQQGADHESNQKVTSTPTPATARLRMESAEADLNRAWQSLTPHRRDQLGQEERNWTRHRNSLPVEERIKSTAERAKYIWSFVERSLDD